MNPLELPWLELSIVVALAGSILVRTVRDPFAASRWGIALTGTAFACAFLAWLAFELGVPSGTGRWDVQTPTLGGRTFALDELSAPLVPAVALIHFLTAVTTSRTRMRYFSISWSLASEAIRLAMFSCGASWVLVALTVICTVPPYFELRNLGRPRRVYVAHMTLFGA
ncbi:MAG: oxidoreductase, partial [Isosphaeraceae bacterium]